MGHTRTNMNIRQWINNFLNRDIRFTTSSPVQPTAISDVNINGQQDRCLHFTIYFANGGRIVETKRYDRMKDKIHNNLYIITPDKEFGVEIDKILTLEALKN